ncbi:hypothetical protein AB0M46_23270 [Dactylosporangium sp. NPDC051485]|uniref:hypothetical protein n=1 Tax=Dactylosporangium sp. NPDC051485 TaxID=3154846 RepID=UPI00344673A6
MGRGLSAQEFIAYAREQMAGIESLLERHRRTGPSCGCGRPLPCPVEETLRNRQEHFSTGIALAERTVQLPVVVPVPVNVGSHSRPRTARFRWCAWLIRRAT